jgi:hypothetical protein
MAGGEEKAKAKSKGKAAAPRGGGGGGDDGEDGGGAAAEAARAAVEEGRRLLDVALDLGVRTSLGRMLRVLLLALGAQRRLPLR